MNKPSPVVTADQFFKVLEASRLLRSQQWGEFRALAHADAKSAARFLVRQGWLTTWQAGQLLGGFHRLVIGNYHLLKEVGRGRWGRVFHAEHRRLGRQVAIKLLAPEWGAQEDLVRQFLAEIRLIAALEHRNLIEIYDAASEGDRYYVVMEYVAGTDLRQHVQRLGPLPVHRAADIAYQTAQVLDHLHARGVLHGEIRPSSLMSTESGLLKLLNAVGTSNRASPSQSAGETGQHYCAPEQRDGRPVDVRTDVYALGRTLHFLLTGRSVGTQAADPPDRPRGAGGGPAALSHLLPEVPREFAAVCAQMMAEAPENRLPTMRDVMAALRAWRSEDYVPTPRSGSHRAAQRPNE